MSISVEAVIRHMVSQNNHKLNIAFPAVVVGVQNLSDGLIDVQPIVNHMNQLTKDTVKYPVLTNVSVVFPNTQKSTICFPINQGDFVDLLVQSVDISKFKRGDSEPHDPEHASFGNIANVVAVVGYTPNQLSCFNPMNYKQDFDNQDLNIVHNKDTEQESSITIKEDGGIVLRSLTKVTVECDDVNLLSKSIDANSATIKTNGDFLIKGKSLERFMTGHNHTGNQGAPTSPPLPI